MAARSGGGEPPLRASGRGVAGVVVQGVENLTRLSGRLVGRGPDPRRADWDLTVVRVTAAAPVEGRADLLSRRVGEDLTVAFRRELLRDALPGARLTFRAHVVPEGALAEVYPDDGDLLVEPA